MQLFKKANDQIGQFTLIFGHPLMYLSGFKVSEYGILLKTIGDREKIFHWIQDA